MATHEALRELRDYGPKHERITEPVVTIHALADEEAVLARIGLSAESCRSCDLWWAYESELVFVSVISDDAASVRFWRTDEGPHSATFLVRTRQAPLRTDHLNRALTYLSSWLKNNPDALMLASETVREVTTDDVCG